MGSDFNISELNYIYFLFISMQTSNAFNISSCSRKVKELEKMRPSAALSKIKGIYSNMASFNDHIVHYFNLCILWVILSLISFLLTLKL